MVNDGSVDSASDTVTINATTANSALVADAYIDQNVNTTSLVTLNGSLGSDANSDSLTYTWKIKSVPSGSSISTWTSKTVVNPTFTPDLDGPYTFELVVNDGIVASEPDTVIINSTSDFTYIGSSTKIYIFYFLQTNETDFHHTIL